MDRSGDVCAKYSSFSCVNGSRYDKARKIVACLEHSLARNLVNLDILEIGFGSGIISNYIAERPNNVFAIDISRGTQQSQLNSSRNMRKPHFAIADGTNLPFQEHVFDVVICNQVIEHIPREYQTQLISESHRVLKLNGLLYISTPNRLWPIEPHTKKPFIHYIPTYVENRYRIYLQNYIQLLSIISLKYQYINDLTLDIIKDPNKFRSNDLSKTLQIILKTIPCNLLEYFLFLSPSWIIIATRTKPPNARENVIVRNLVRRDSK